MKLFVVFALCEHPIETNVTYFIRQSQSQSLSYGHWGHVQHCVLFSSCNCDSCYRNKWAVQDSVKAFTPCDCDSITISYTIHYNKKQITFANHTVWTDLRGSFTLCDFFLIATAIPLIATNGFHRTQWKCSHYATMTTSPTPIQPIMSKNKSQSQIAQCERALKVFYTVRLQLRLRLWFFLSQFMVVHNSMQVFTWCDYHSITSPYSVH